MANVKRQVLIEATIAEVLLKNQFSRDRWSVLRVRGLTSVLLIKRERQLGFPAHRGSQHFHG